MKSQSNLDIAQAIDILSRIVGEYVWFVRCVEDRILRLEFGNQHLVIHEPRNTSSTSEAVRTVLNQRVVVPAGRWSLFIEDGIWHVQTSTRKCSRLDTDKVGIDKCLRQLEGQKLLSTEYISATRDWVFNFDISGVLVIKDHLEFEENAQWIMFFEDGGNLSYVNSSNIILDVV